MRTLGNLIGYGLSTVIALVVAFFGTYELLFYIL